MKKYADWNPIKSPLVQNLLLGSVVGIMMAINLRVIIFSEGRATWAWVILFLIGPIFGFLSGLERMRYEKRKEEK
jgi:hypothetical protein